MSRFCFKIFMENLKIVFSTTNAILFTGIAAFHYYWSFGGKYGYKAVLPEIETSGKKVFAPGKLATCLVATLFLCVALGFFLISIKSTFVSASSTSYFLYTIAAATFIRAIGDFKYVGFLKKKSQSLFAINDTKYYSPLCLFMAVSSVFIETQLLA
jgi:hypothetical protein